METQKGYTINNARIDEERNAWMQNIHSKNANEASIKYEVNGEFSGNNLRGCRNSEDTGNDLEAKPIDLTQRLATDEELSESSFISLQENSFNILPASKVHTGARTKASFAITKIIQADHLYSNEPKKRGRKRKANFEVPSNIPSPQRFKPDSPEYVHTPVDTRQAEVLMAAKSLFSKRTRTLYHWMYPNTPKAQLKSFISASWENLGQQEKGFYISQVLGRFGFPQSSLMINPLLGGLKGLPILSPPDFSSSSNLNSETHRAISSILERQENVPDEGSSSWGQNSNIFFAPHPETVSHRYSKRGRPPTDKSQKHLREQSVPVKSNIVENPFEDFQDDPELKLEFEQFKRALHTNK